MNTSLQLDKMRNRRKRAGKRGFSSVVGAVFMVLIMSVLASSYFVYTFSENNLYNNSVAQKSQLDQSVRAENLQCGNTTYTCYPYPSTNVNVQANITNVGSTSVQFIAFWICASNYTSGTAWTGYNFASLNASIQPGQTYLLNNSQGINLTVSGFISTYNYSYTYASWLVTSRGNKVALQTQIASSNVVISSQVAQGIGSISMNFKEFYFYDFGTSSPNVGDPVGTPTNSFNMWNTHYTILSVLLTDYDNSTQDITLTSDSYIWILSAQGGTLKSQAWPITNVTGNIIKPFSTQILSYSTPTRVYFGPVKPGFAAAVFNTGPQVFAVFILLFGQVQGKDFGQNIPFVAFRISE